MYSIYVSKCRSCIFCCCCCSVTELCPTVCDLMGCSRPGFPVLHYLLEFAQIHVHWAGGAIQPSHPLLPLLLLPSTFPSIRVFSNESALHIKCPKYQSHQEHQHQSFKWTVSVDFLSDWLVQSPCSPRDSQESSPAPQFKSINSLALRLPCSPALTSIHDYWKNDSFDYMALCWQSDVSAS